MQNKNTKRCLVASIFCLGILATSCDTGNGWYQFRGSDGNNVVSGKGYPEEWGTDRNVKWTYDVEGRSYSSPVIQGNKVFFTTAFSPTVNETEMSAPQQTATGGQGAPPAAGQGAPPAAGQGAPPQDPMPQPAEQELDGMVADIYEWSVICLDLNTGDLLWKETALKGNPRKGKHPNGTYANESPVTDGKYIYAYFGNVGLFCYDLDGNLIWKNDMDAYNTLNKWGTGSSPVINDNILYVQFDNEDNSFVIAFDANTGEEIWKAAREEKTNYSTPLVWKNSIRTELVTLGKTARSYDAKTGELLWQIKLDGEMAVPSPNSNGDLVYVGITGGTLYAVKAGASGDLSLPEGITSSEYIQWSVPKAGVGNSSPVYYEGLLYVVSNRGGNVVCYDGLTGEKVYSTKIDGAGAFWSTPWFYDGKMLVADDKGVTHVIQTGKEYKLLGQNKLNDIFWTSVAASNGKYILKGAQSLYCLTID